MLSSLAGSLSRRWKPLSFSNTNFIRIPATQLIEEEALPDYVASRYYPAQIGEVVREQYQIVGKLGFGATSTVWLARDLRHRRHVALKVFIHSAAMGNQMDDELEIYQRMAKGPKNHPGRDAVRSLLDHFDLSGPDGQHRCLVHSPLWDSVLTFLYRNPVRRLPVPVLAVILKRLFSALYFLHTECGIIHADVKADNIMFGINDDSVFRDFEEQELRNPCPRKEGQARTVYTSRELGMPKRLGAPVLCDFGSAIPGEGEHFEDIQPNVYRAPEVILEYPWTYSVDIWNAGCMIWDIFEGGHLFTGNDPEIGSYRSAAHLADIITLLGPPPSKLLSGGRLREKFFADDGTLEAGLSIQGRIDLNQRETTLTGQDKVEFLQLMSKMLQWQPEDRSTAKELIEDLWILKHT